MNTRNRQCICNVTRLLLFAYDIHAVAYQYMPQRLPSAYRSGVHMHNVNYSPSHRTCLTGGRIELSLDISPVQILAIGDNFGGSHHMLHEHYVDAI